MKDPQPIWNTEPYAKAGKEIKVKKKFNMVEDINRSVLSDEEKIAALVKHVRSCDEGCAEILADAQALKVNYDNNAMAAAEARAELLKYGIKIDNQFGGITI